MAKRKKPETVVFDGCTWERHDGGVDGDLERWILVGFPGLFIRVTNYGEGLRGEYRSGWRVVGGGCPSKEKYDSRDAAIADALKTIRREANTKLWRAEEQMKEAREVAKAVGALPR